MNDYIFEEIQENELPIVREIYNYFIENTTVTFHTQKLTVDELKAFIYINHPKYKSYFIKDKDTLEIYGYCLLTRYKARQAYDRTAEVTIYLKNEYQRKGIGRQAIQFLENIARQNQIKVLIASISGENTGSIQLFEKLGYEKCAHYKQVGEKFGRILDVVDYQKIL